MSIICKCACGQVHKLADEDIGRTIQCQSCKQPLRVAAARSEPSDKVPSEKRGLTLTDLALAVGGILMAAGVLWYFIGYKLFGGERLYPAAMLFGCGMLTILRNIIKDMDR